MTLATHPQAARPVSRPAPARRRCKAPRIQQEAIEGRYRPIRSHQLMVAWWLFSAGHISKRALRVYFASHELAERRRYTSPKRKGHALYGLNEIKKLVGGSGSATADRDLSDDVKRLRELGLVEINASSIAFATSIEQIRLGDTTDFFAMWALMRKGMARRHVPVPRRTLRALAAGFRTADTAYVIGAMLSAVFWHKQDGRYSTDGRLKDRWVAETFRIGLSSARGARKHLVELGWLQELDTPQWLLNRYGMHIAVNVDWAPGQTAAANDAVDNSHVASVGEGGAEAESDTPSVQNSGQSSTPCLNRSPLSTRDLNTRRLGAAAPDPSGVSRKERGQKQAAKRNRQSDRSTTKPSIRDIRPEHLGDPKALLELRRQAIALGFAFKGASGELDFLALANRARTRGSNPSALFFDLISNHRTAFITITDEEMARTQLRELREGSTKRSYNHDWGGGPFAVASSRQLTEEEHVVETCIRVAKQHRGMDPFKVARKVKQWTRPQWDSAYLRYQSTQMRQWQGLDNEIGTFS